MSPKTFMMRSYRRARRDRVHPAESSRTSTSDQSDDCVGIHCEAIELPLACKAPATSKRGPSKPPALRGAPAVIELYEVDEDATSPQTSPPKKAKNEKRVAELLEPAVKQGMLSALFAAARSGATAARQQETFEAAANAAQASAEELRQFVADMLSSFQLMEHQPGWEAAVDTLRAAALRPAPLGTAEACELVLSLLQAGEPHHPTHATAVLLRRQSDMGVSDALHVAAATLCAAQVSSRLKSSAVWKAQSANQLSTDAHAVLQSGSPLLRSPYGEDPSATSLAPLRQKDGRCFGVLLAAAPAYPDEWVECMARAAGPLIERAAKRQAASTLVQRASAWLRQASYRTALICGSRDPLLCVEWCESDAASPSAEWQPLAHMEGDAMRTFRCALPWTGGTLGTLRIDVRELDGPTLGRLDACAHVLLAAVTHIESGRVGDPPPLPLRSADEFESALRSATAEAAARLRLTLGARLRAVDASALIAEVRAYTQPAVEVHRVLAGVLALLGHPRKQMRTWEALKRRLGSAILSELSDATAKLHTLRWRESSLATKGVPLSKLLLANSCPQPVRMLCKGLLAARIVHSMTAPSDGEGARRTKPTRDESAPPATAPGSLQRAGTPTEPMAADLSGANSTVIERFGGEREAAALERLVLVDMCG